MTFCKPFYRKISCEIRMNFKTSDEFHIGLTPLFVNRFINS